ncbi:DsbA family protein, partial [Enterobacter sp. 63]
AIPYDDLEELVKAQLASARGK